MKPRIVQLSFPSPKARDQVAGNCETMHQMFVYMPFAVVKLFYIPFLVHIIVVFSVLHCSHSDLFSVREELRILFVVLRLTCNKIGMSNTPKKCRKFQTPLPET